MAYTRRTFLVATAAASTVTVLPFAVGAAGHSGDVFSTADGDITVHPVAHASFVMETPSGVIYSDPVGDPAQYSGFPEPGLILVTHAHGDHFNLDTLNALVKGGTQLIVNPAVHEKLSDALKAKATVMSNGDSGMWDAVSIDAIPAYNTTEGRLKFHPQGRDNGYVLTINGFRVYISGDTEDIPEMRALTGIDLAFVAMNLPFTMDVAAAADAVAEFRPRHVYPYHYRGRDGGTQDPAEFAKLVGDASVVQMGPWYKPGELG